MKLIVATSAIFLASFGNPVFAACNGANNTYLTQAQINTLLSSRTACGKVASGPNAPGWNETHSASPGGTVIEFHDGAPATGPGLPTWNTSSVGTGAATRGRVTYTYSGGVVPVYEISVKTGTCSGPSCTAPQLIEFCGVGGGAPAVLNIQITAAPANLINCTGTPN